MRLLDLYCCAGGASMGYHQAGFEVTGVDINQQDNYPFEFVRGDALEFLRNNAGHYDVIHASPPCQRYSTGRTRNRRGQGKDHPDLVEATRELLVASGVSYVIENVEGAPLIDPIRLCGSSFGLDVRRHRLFESNLPIVGKPCDHSWQTPRFPVPDKRKGEKLSCVVPVYGQRNYAGDLELRRRAMGISWMTNLEIIEAIPPAYTRFIGEQLMEAIKTGGNV